MTTKRLEIVRKVERVPGEVELPPELENAIKADLRRQHHAEKAYAEALNAFQLAQQQAQAATVELQKRNERAAAKIEMALEMLSLPSDHFDARYDPDSDRAIVWFPPVQQPEGEAPTEASMTVAQLKAKRETEAATAQQAENDDPVTKEGKDDAAG